MSYQGLSPSAFVLHKTGVMSLPYAGEMSDDVYNRLDIVVVFRQTDGQNW